MLFYFNVPNWKTISEGIFIFFLYVGITCLIQVIKKYGELLLISCAWMWERVVLDPRGTRNLIATLRFTTMLWCKGTRIKSYLKVPFHIFSNQRIMNARLFCWTIKKCNWCAMLRGMYFINMIVSLLQTICSLITNTTLPCNILNPKSSTTCTLLGLWMIYIFQSSIISITFVGSTKITGSLG